MLIPLSWLKQYVDFDVPVEEFAHRMIMTGAEVEGWEVLGKGLEKVVVGRIAKLSRHPDADRLLLCQIDVGEAEPLPVVTGAPNVFEGALVPVARVGAALPNGVKIQKSKLRGELSLGMLCSGQELCIDDTVYPGAQVDGILILQGDWAPGTGMAQVLGLDDVVVDFKTLANRPDCMSLLGTAREAAVTLDRPFVMPDTAVTARGEDSTPALVRVSVEAPDLCPRYMARIVRDVKIAPSPAWMQRCLRAAGVRPINNIVDITNFVMLEIGQPLHAFDRRQVEGGQIIVRRALPGESIMTLDGRERSLSGQMLVIANARVPMAVAGIMGGEHSGIAADTGEVIFESACFERSGIRITSRALGLRSESSARFEKGIPPELNQLAMDRAMHLVTELGAGRVVPGCVDECQADLTPRVVSARASDINRLLGQQLSAHEMAVILRRLFIETQVEGDTLRCTLPAHRGDIEEMADLAEEVQRIYGYDKIPCTPMTGELQVGKRTPKQELELDVRTALAGYGLREAVTYSFFGPSDLKKLMLAPDSPLLDTLSLMNPLGEEYSLMRTTLVPGVLGSLQNNHSRQIESVSLYEIGRTYRPLQNPPTELPRETLWLCIGVMAPDADFFRVKGLLEALLARCRVDHVRFEAQGPGYLHPGRCAQVYAGKTLLGCLGEVHPDVAANYELDRRAYLAELDLDTLLTVMPTEAIAVRPLPRFPQVIRDLAVTVAADQPVGPMLERIRTAAGALLEDVSLFDIYQGQQTAPGQKSVAFSLTLRAPDRTLQDEEANAVFDRVLGALSNDFGAKLRA